MNKFNIIKYYNQFIVDDSDYIEDWLYGHKLGFLRRRINYKEFGILIKKINE